MTWREILERWSSPAPVAEPPGAAPPLAAFLRAGGAAALSHQNRFQQPEDEDGWSVFYVENQHVCTWAYRTGDPDEDPAVHVSEDGPYRPVGARLDAFLSAAAVLEATFGQSATRAAHGPSASASAVLGMPELDLPDLGWPPNTTTTYHEDDDVLAFAEIHGERASLFAGARSEDALAKLISRIHEIDGWEEL